MGRRTAKSKIEDETEQERSDALLESLQWLITQQRPGALIVLPGDPGPRGEQARLRRENARLREALARLLDTIQAHPPSPEPSEHQITRQAVLARKTLRSLGGGSRGL